jgi:hypothetical protein
MIGNGIRLEDFKLVLDQRFSLESEEIALHMIESNART